MGCYLCRANLLVCSKDIHAPWTALGTAMRQHKYALIFFQINAWQNFFSALIVSRYSVARHHAVPCRPSRAAPLPQRAPGTAGEPAYMRSSPCILQIGSILSHLTQDVQLK